MLVSLDMDLVALRPPALFWGEASVPSVVQVKTTASSMTAASFMSSGELGTLSEEMGAPPRWDRARVELK